MNDNLVSLVHPQFKHTHARPAIFLLSPEESFSIIKFLATQNFNRTIKYLVIQITKSDSQYFTKLVRIYYNISYTVYVTLGVTLGVTQCMLQCVLHWVLQCMLH